MTSLLEKAIESIKLLPESKQDIMAAFILERLESDWDKQIEQDFAANGNLYWLLNEAQLEIISGKVNDGGFGNI
ncbi:MAG: hypothetical protein SFU98_04625 [Leptospiraceae bacterium]|nr:hypothetical protein [Leptospiraceae bacterium]